MARRFWRRGAEDSADDELEQPLDDQAVDMQETDEQAAADQMPSVEEIMGYEIAHEDAPGLEVREPVRFRWPLLVIIGALVAAIILVAGGMNARIPADLLARWPWLLLIGGGLWFLVGLVTGWPSGTLGGPVVAIVGLIVLWGQQGQVAASPMIFGGAMLIAGSAAFILRGLTMPRT